VSSLHAPEHAQLLERLLARDPKLSPAERESLANCPQCSAEIQSLAAAQELLQRLGDQARADLAALGQEPKDSAALKKMEVQALELLRSKAAGLRPAASTSGPATNPVKPALAAIGTAQRRQALRFLRPLALLAAGALVVVILQRPDPEPQPGPDRPIPLGIQGQSLRCEVGPDGFGTFSWDPVDQPGTLYQLQVFEGLGPEGQQRGRPLLDPVVTEECAFTPSAEQSASWPNRIVAELSYEMPGGFELEPRSASFSR
jgi:hypothetical protein